MPQSSREPPRRATSWSSPTGCRSTGSMRLGRHVRLAHVAWWARHRPRAGAPGSRTASGSAGPGRAWTTTRPSRPTVCTWSRSSSPTSRSRSYYEGMSNGTLWPLYHDVVAKPEFHREWWEAYVQVNQRFADAAAEAAAKDGVVWVQDYQLQLVPAMLRRSGPTCGSASSCTSRSRRPSCSSSCRGATRSSKVCSAPTWSASSGQGARPTSPGWSAHGSDTRRTATRSASTTAGPSRPAPTRSRSTSTAFEELAAQPGRRGARRRDPRPSSATPPGCCSASTGSTTPRASGNGCARSAS